MSKAANTKITSTQPAACRVTLHGEHRSAQKQHYQRQLEPVPEPTGSNSTVSHSLIRGSGSYRDCG